LGFALIRRYGDDDDDRGDDEDADEPEPRRSLEAARHAAAAYPASV